jgi:hypothetical protein
VKNLTKKNTIGTILGSVFITLLLVGVGGYFGLPLIYPILNEDLTDEGILLQTKYYENKTQIFIVDTDLVEEKMPDTELNITTSGNSKLRVAFDALFLIHLDSAFSGGTRYNITLVLSGVRNRTTRVSYFSSPSLGTTIEESYSPHITFETGILTAGTYSISVYWKSNNAASTGSSMLFSLDGYARSIMAQEIAG